MQKIPATLLLDQLSESVTLVDRVKAMQAELDELESLNASQANTIEAVVRLANIRARRVQLLERRLAYALEHYVAATGSPLEMGLVQ